jgi:hypothetical protein
VSEIRIVNQFIAAQNVRFLQSVRELLVFDGCELNWHFQFVFAALREPSKEVEKGVVEHNHYYDEDSLGKDDHIIEDTVEISTEE